jgi:EAL domain-containing protein (putative c-di-GMP-specific phosphodiesterase class I)
VPTVVQILEATGVNPARLKLEVTESLFISDMEEVLDKMNQLKDRGLQFSLDDFGTGYSSLTYLKRMPLSELKIDQSFVRDILTDPSDAITVRTILALGHSMGLEVLAEGVETPGQLAFLEANGCDLIQGYLFSPPLPVDDLETWMAKRLTPC